MEVQYVLKPVRCADCGPSVIALGYGGWPRCRGCGQRFMPDGDQYLHTFVVEGSTVLTPTLVVRSIEGVPTKV